MTSATHNASAIESSRATKPLLEIADLAVSFDVGASQRVQAVDGVSLTIHPRQTLAVVGESGCGKSVTALSVLRLLPQPPACIDRGSVFFEGRDLLTLTQKQILAVRGGQIAMIFQEPMTSLNPVMAIGQQIIEAILLHQKADRKQARDVAIQAMNDVGIPNPAERLAAYPHQFSGGMRQRVMIAMALACRPRLLLADEPTTALDVTIQAQILELLRGLQDTRDMAMLLITHNLGVVAGTADVVCVMYAGRVVEYARVFELFEQPLHPYTRGLFKSIPRLNESRHRLTTVDEIVNDPRQYRMLPGAERGLVPWWPTMPQPPDMATSPDGRDCVLHEISPDHWIGCWRTEYVESHSTHRPDINWRR